VEPPAEGDADVPNRARRRTDERLDVVRPPPFGLEEGSAKSLLADLNCALLDLLGSKDVVRGA
jgi:hypothetical protein